MNRYELELLFQLHQQVQNLGLDRHVECRYRLIADHQRWLDHQGTGDANALALPARKFMRIPVARVAGQAHTVQDGCDASLSVLA